MPGLSPYLVRLVLLAGVVTTAGCTTNVRQGFYEGLRVRNDLQSSPSERLGQPAAPDFATYERMRQNPPQ